MAAASMQYRTNPKNGEQLSALGFGCMRFPVGAELREQLITGAVKAGVNYFDTAYVYPGNEAALGNILKKHMLREQVHVADKLPHNKCRINGDMEKLFAESLERLQTDYIDYYLIHNLGSPEAWDRLVRIGAVEWIAEKKAAGQIRNVGFSFHGKAVDFVPLLDAYDWDCAMIQYNYMNENYQAGTAGLNAIRERGLAAIIMEPLLGGKLAQKLPQKAKEEFDKAVPGRSPVEWAFKWLWDKPEVTVVLSGMNEMEQLKQNIETAAETPAGSLTAEEKAVYGKVFEAVAESFKIPCTGCNYCMPCPFNVNIPSCFMAYNMSFAMGFLTAVRIYFNATSLGETGPAKCKKCGACVKKCPQNIAVPERLAEVYKRMEPLPVRAATAVVSKFLK